ncbi:hypothetical protein FACS1894172_02310 [Spirochaetia bacterium]|nr:hypothetical protein FACS1894172_02310 [Spirochaetia bacterium]
MGTDLVPRYVVNRYLGSDLDLAFRERINRIYPDTFYETETRIRFGCNRTIQPDSDPLDLDKKKKYTTTQAFDGYKNEFCGREVWKIKIRIKHGGSGSGYV